MTVTLKTLVNFNGTNGGDPQFGSLITDAHGNLFGTTAGGGALNGGTVFEIAKTASGYAKHPTILVQFHAGSTPHGLIIDAHGNLFGTTSNGGANNDGTVFEITKTASGYAKHTLVSFDGTDGSHPHAGLIADANGDLFGTTSQGGADLVGTVFEIAKTASGYARTPTTLVSFDGADGFGGGGLIIDANGNLFGTSGLGGANNDGTVFEIANTASGYASTPTTLVSFNGTDGSTSNGSLIIDANGDLFGTTATGGASNLGTVFEIAKTASGYASTPTTLVSFNGTDGRQPETGLIIDANGDLFGTTFGGGANLLGTVFEIAKTASGYASTPTTLVSFNGTDGSNPLDSVFANAHGDLFGTTVDGGAHFVGTVFEITGSGFAFM